MCGFFLHKSHYVSNSKSCVSIDLHYIFVQVVACQMLKTCKKLCQKYTLVWGWTFSPAFMGLSASVCDVVVMCFEDLVRGSISLDFSLPQYSQETWRFERVFRIPALRIWRFICEMGGGYKLCPKYATTYIPTLFFYSQLSSVNSKPNRLVHEIVRVRFCEIQANYWNIVDILRILIFMLWNIVMDDWRLN